MKDSSKPVEAPKTGLVTTFQCRICGEVIDEAHALSATATRGCARCGGSPLCDTCGHRRADHRGLFGTQGSGCRTRIRDVPTLTLSFCACPGYSPRTEAFGEARFAEPEPSVLPPLRVADFS
jgi:hypothetical protein